MEDLRATGISHALIRGSSSKVLEWLHGDDLILDYEFWDHHHLAVHPWQCIDSSSLLPPMQRVSVTIKDFPLDFWHPCYFRQATSSMGILVGVSSAGLRGTDYTALQLLLDCHDLNLIPYKLRLAHAGRWTECSVELDGRVSETSLDPPPSSPPSPPQGGPQNSNPNGFLRFIPPYVPPSRRRLMHLPLPFPDPARRGTPTAAYHA